MGKPQDGHEVAPESLSTEGLVTAVGSQSIDTLSPQSTIQAGASTTVDSIISGSSSLRVSS